MTDAHRHDWDWEYPNNIHNWGAFVCDCGASMLTDDVVRRLNAAEHLSAEDASTAAHFFTPSDREKLLAYAKALEGDDDKTREA